MRALGLINIICTLNYHWLALLVPIMIGSQFLMGYVRDPHHVDLRVDCHPKANS